MKNNKEYFVYGLNNAISILSHQEYLISSIILMKDGIAQSDPTISKYLKNNKDCISMLSKNDFLSKYNYKHTQGIVIFFLADFCLLYTSPSPRD